MTEQRKIIPSGTEPAPPEVTPGPRPMRSSVERAVEGFDLSRLGGIMLPPDGRQRVVMRELSIEPMPDPAPAAAVPPVVEVVPAPQTAPVVAAPAPVAPPQLPVAPVCFSATRHPVDRKRLRDQGLIVPEGTVTGLMEEFRIVKRQLLLQAAELARAGRAPRRSASLSARRCRARGRPIAPPIWRWRSRPKRKARSCWSTPTSPSLRSFRSWACPAGQG